MSRKAAEDFYAAIEKCSGLLDVDCQRAKVWPVVNAFADVLPQAAILFRVATDKRHAGELNCHLMMLPGDTDPYAVALSHGLLAKTQHPVGALVADIAQRFAVDSYGLDFGIVGGFQKTWSCFPGDSMQKLAELAGVPSMPRSLAGNMDFFARYGLTEKVTLIGTDYAAKTMNVYFGEVDDCLEEAAIRSMLHDMEMPPPSDQLLAFAQHSFGFYATLGWDSPKIQRFCYSVITPDPMALLEHVEPKIEHFLKTIPYGASDPKAVYVATSPTDGGEFYKIQSYYQWRPRLVKHMHTSVPGSRP
jgi:hypothetical protein